MSNAPELWSHGWVLPPTASSSPLCQTNFGFPPTASFRLHDTMLHASTRIVTHEFFCASLTQTFFLLLQSPYSSHDRFLVVEKRKSCQVGMWLWTILCWSIWKAGVFFLKQYLHLTECYKWLVVWCLSFCFFCSINIIKGRKNDDDQFVVRKAQPRVRCGWYKNRATLSRSVATLYLLSPDTLWVMVKLEWNVQISDEYSTELGSKTHQGQLVPAYQHWL